MRGKPQPYKTTPYALPLGFNGRLAGTYRWFSGRPLNGHRYTDATGFRYGTMATDLSGRATTFQLLPGYKRFLYARVPMMLAPVVGAYSVYEPGQVGLSVAILGTLSVPKVVKARRSRRFRKDITEPVSAAVSGVLREGHEAGRGHLWVHVPENYRDEPDAKIVVRLPMAWTADKGDRTRIVDVVAERLQLEDITPSWQLYGATPSVVFSVPPKPPVSVSWDEAVDDLDKAKEDGPVIGYGARSKLETFDLKLEAPHLMIAGASNAGKSETIAWIVCHFMRHGYGIMCLDAKYTSHMWLRKIPGVLYASENQELHDALVWLDQELVERARFISKGGDPATLVPLLAVLEEMNGASNRLRSYWRSIKASDEPMMSPALTALQNLASMGREMRVHIILAGQSLSAKAVGGPETRENFGGRMFGRATQAQWRMLAPQIKKAPAKQGPPGRWHIVVGETVREFQVPFSDIKGHEARLIEHATGGKEIPDVVEMMAAWDGGGGGEELNNSSSEPPTPAGISLRQYADESGINLATLQKWRERRSDFPSWVGLGARGVQLFERDHLRAYARDRLREPVTADE